MQESLPDLIEEIAQRLQILEKSLVPRLEAADASIRAKLPFHVIQHREGLAWRCAELSRDALDAIRNARSDEDYRDAAASFQRVAINDPPAIFLAWGERARVVSSRFRVPAEPGRDVLATLRLWRPATDERTASKN